MLLDKVLPFGLRSAPLIFTAVADALQWIFHYLDDFITLGPPLSPQCQRNLEGIIHSCQSTGTPLEEDKCEGPSSVISFLGMELDSQKMEIRLPADKLERLRQLLTGPESGQEEGTALPDRLPAACIQGSPSRSLIPTSANCSIHGG